MNPIFRSILTSGRSLHSLLVSSSHCAAPQFTSPMIKQTIRGFAAAAPKKGKKQAAAPVEEKKKSDSLIPINIFVDGKDPEVLPDDQYPDWLWHMLDPKVSSDEWETKQFKGATEKDMTDIIRVKAARRIKEYNMSKAK